MTTVTHTLGRGRGGVSIVPFNDLAQAEARAPSHNWRDSSASRAWIGMDVSHSSCKAARVAVHMAGQQGPGATVLTQLLPPCCAGPH